MCREQWPVTPFLMETLKVAKSGVEANLEVIAILPEGRGLRLSDRAFNPSFNTAGKGGWDHYPSAFPSGQHLVGTSDRVRPGPCCREWIRLVEETSDSHISKC